MVLRVGETSSGVSPVLLGDHAGRQLRRLCAALGLGAVDGVYTALLRDLLGPAAARAVSAAPAWESAISDDHTPVEYSVTFDMDQRPRLRFLVEPSARWPDLWANMEAGLQILETVADRYEFSLERFSMLQDLFFPRRPRGSFGLWLGAELARSGIPDFKVYLNPAVQGADRAWQVVGEALTRLGFGTAFPVLLRHGVARDRQLDRFYLKTELGYPSPDEEMAIVRGQRVLS